MYSLYSLYICILFIYLFFLFIYLFVFIFNDFTDPIHVNVNVM